MKEIVKEVIKVGGVVALDYLDQEINNYIRENITDEIIDDKVKKLKYEVENYDCFVRLYYRSSDYYDKNMNKNLKKALRFPMALFSLASAKAKRESSHALSPVTDRLYAFSCKIFFLK